MNSAPVPAAPAWQSAWSARVWRRQALALSVALLLHGLAFTALLSHWQAKAAAEPRVRTLSTQLLSLAPAAVAAPALPPAEPAPVPARVEPAQSKPAQAQPPLEQAKLARKRLAQQEQAREQAREQLLAERQRAEQQRAAAALAHQQASQQAQQRQQNEAAAADARARAAADTSRQYLPIAKAAPDYPERALDKGIEGDCSVSYSVSPQGRVVDPQVAGDCHPLFVRPSLAAAKSFRYQPRIIDGHAVAVAKVTNTFHYRIQD